MKPVVMLPTYNERENIVGLLGEVLAQDGRIEVLVVDDDSPDGTGQLVAEAAKKEKRIHLFTRRGVRGRASAGIAGFKKALELGYDVVIEMDADHSHDPKYIGEFLREIGNADVVVGSRYMGGGGSRQDKLLQHLISRFANVFNGLVLGLGVSDSSGGFKCYRREVLEKIGLDGFISTGYSIGVETLYRAKRAGFRIKEIPIIFRPRARGKSKLNWGIILGYPLTVLRLRFH